MEFGLIGTKTIAGLGLIGIKAVVYLWYNYRENPNWFDITGIKTISGLGLIST